MIVAVQLRGWEEYINFYLVAIVDVLDRIVAAFLLDLEGIPNSQPIFFSSPAWDL